MDVYQCEAVPDKKRQKPPVACKIKGTPTLFHRPRPPLFIGGVARKITRTDQFPKGYPDPPGDQRIRKPRYHHFHTADIKTWQELEYMHALASVLNVHIQYARSSYGAA